MLKLKKKNPTRRPADAPIAIYMSHPYYPRNLRIDQYTPNSTSTNILLVYVLAAVTIWLGAAFWLAGTSAHMKPGRDRAIFCWFALCALTHCSFEPYWVIFNKTVASRQDIFAQLFREYSHADSRYMVSDPLVVTLETMTVAVIGPFCIMAMKAIYFNSPNRHIYQLIISVFHLISCSLYFIMDSYEGFPNCDPEFVYFWVYFIGFNAPWLVVSK
jgi:cholestenol delta-isomerase